MGRGESEFTVVGDNKILTVSYGTFSCTLEGFDDPFSTMKNIAEYFRDLAAGDRFFGAEPPQPDPEMLQSIAEQTIQARVNAQLSDGGLVLRQDAAPGSAPSVAAPAAAAVTAAAVAPHVTPSVAPTPTPPTPGAETVAEKLQRIRAAVSRETAQDALFSEDQHVEEFAAETTAPQQLLEPQIDEPEDVVSEDIQSVEAEADETVAEVEDTVEAVEPVEEAEVADEVQPEEAVVDTPAEDATNEFEEDADAAGDIDLSAIVQSDKASEETVDEVVEDTAEDVVADAEDSPAEEPSADLTEEMDATAREEAAEEAVDSVLGKVSDDEDGDEAAPRRRIVVQKITREDLRAARKEAQAAAVLKDEGSDEVSDASASSELPPEQEEDLLRELAALQADDDVPAAEMTLENEPSNETDSDLADGLADVVDASRRTDDEDLVNALSSMVTEDEDTYKEEEQSAAREMRRARREAITEDDEQDVERLITTTTSRIDNDESSQRRASIAHLKAAVAATKADASLTEAAQEQEARERDQYAEDLARVVRPERKSPSGERAKTDRPAPLVLVSELRIDKPEDDTEAVAPAKEDGPVRPRRVSRADADDEAMADDKGAATDADQESFAEYAASANALELPDLLEAAAAYYTYVESTEQFTRPMLMRKIASISARDGVSREAGLRSFGTLLREGKLVKGTDGKFVIAKTSRFTPEARYAGE